jgi:flavodoxin I
MKVLVVYESVYGNTEKVARAIAAAYPNQAEVGVIQVSSLTKEQLAGVELLIVSSPTQAFRPFKETKAWLASLVPGSLKGIKVAAFDTRLSVKDVNNVILTIMVKFFGYAAKPIGDALVKAGGVLIAEPEGFYVKASEGPLKDGELERAAEWAMGLFAKM